MLDRFSQMSVFKQGTPTCGLHPARCIHCVAKNPQFGQLGANQARHDIPRVQSHPYFDRSKRVRHGDVFGHLKERFGEAQDAPVII